MSDQFPLFTAQRHGETLLGFAPAALTPPAGHLARGRDVGGSLSAAEDVVASGQAETEARLVYEALTRNPGATSAELAHRTPHLGAHADQNPDQWRTTVARRLPGLEDRGLVRAKSPRPSIARPDRSVDPTLSPCTVTGRVSLRWWPEEIR